MKVLLDECVPIRLAQLLEGHEVTHVTLVGWSGIKNGELVSRASVIYDVLISVDYGLPSQIVSEPLAVPVIVLHGASNKLKHIKRLVPELLAILGGSLENKVYHLGSG